MLFCYSVLTPIYCLDNCLCRFLRFCFSIYTFVSWRFNDCKPDPLKLWTVLSPTLVNPKFKFLNKEACSTSFAIESSSRPITKEPRFQIIFLLVERSCDWCILSSLFLQVENILFTGAYWICQYLHIMYLSSRSQITSLYVLFFQEIDHYLPSNKVGTQSTFCNTQNVTVIRVKRRKTCRSYSIRLDLMLLEKNKYASFLNLMFFREIKELAISLMEYQDACHSEPPSRILTVNET